MTEGPSKAFNSTADEQVELGEVIERQRFGLFALMLMVFASLTMFLEGFEMQLVGYAAPVMIKVLHTSKAAFGSIFGSGNLGYMLGALGLGYLGDRFGRRRLIISGVFLFGCFTLLSAYAASVAQLSVLRFVAGIGLGGAVPSTLALTAEYAPRGRRATRIALLYVAYTLGGATTGIIAAGLLPAYGWPVVFLIGGWSGLAVGVLLWCFLPESVRFLARMRTDEGRLRHIVEQMLPERSLAPLVRIVQNEETSARPAHVTALFQDGRGSVTLLLWIAYICSITALQFMTSWLPTLIQDAGIALSLALFTGALFHIGGTLGNVIAGWLIDRKGARAIAAGFFIAMPFVAMMGPAGAVTPLLMTIVFLAGMCIVGSQNGLNAAATIIYPTWMRSTGAGWTTGVGRLGSIIGPVLGGLLISSRMPRSELFLCATVPLGLAAASMALISSRTTAELQANPATHLARAAVEEVSLRPPN